MKVGIDALRNHSGGAINYLANILKYDPRVFNIELVHIWGSSLLLNSLPDNEWLVKHVDKNQKKSIFKQLYWQRFCLKKELIKNDCDVLFITDAGSVSRFDKAVVMSRDMLPFEQKEYSRYKIFSLSRLRLFILRLVSVSSFKQATSVIFLTEYAKNAIEDFTGKLPKHKIIPHGLSEIFKQDFFSVNWKNAGGIISCVYVSNVDYYKHQWHVVHGIKKLRDLGYDVKLTLIGDYNSPANILLDESIAKYDKDDEFVEKVGHVHNKDLPLYLKNADIFIFASSCENMPNTLLEGMASGLPIACSRKGPMPDILLDGGVYFDPEDPDSITKALKQLIGDHEIRQSKAKISKSLSQNYSWEKCAENTWKCIVEVASSK